jgi:hypothetical protein
MIDEAWRLFQQTVDAVHMSIVGDLGLATSSLAAVDPLMWLLRLLLWKRI